MARGLLFVLTSIMKSMAFPIYCLLFFLLQNKVVFAAYVEEELDTASGFIGGKVSLRCDLKNIPIEYPIIWYHSERQQYLTHDEEIYDYAPEELKNRISANCYRLRYQSSVCTTTITALTAADKGTYHCGYVDQVRVHFLKVVTVNITQGNPPSEESPICEIFTAATDGRYVSSPTGHSVGDTIYLGCKVQGASLKPTILWQRGNDSQIELPPIVGLSVRHEVKLSIQDVGAEFFCIMTHPSLDSPRNCSLIPLPSISTSPSTSTAEITSTASVSSSVFTPSTLSISFTSSVSSMIQTGDNATKQLIAKVTQPTPSSREQPLTLPAIIAVLMIFLVLAIGVMVFLVWRRRSKKLKIPSIPNYEMTFERDCSITPEYAVVNAPDSIDKAKKFKSVTALPCQTPISNDHNHNNKNRQSSHLSVSYNQQEAKEVYDNTEEYENFTLTQRNNTDGGNLDGKGDPSQEGLMYADLDLPEVSDSLNNARISLSYQNATVYADIQGTL